MLGNRVGPVARGLSSQVKVLLCEMLGSADVREYYDVKGKAFP